MRLCDRSAVYVSKMCKWFIWEVEQIKSDLRELVAMTLCIRDEVIEYVMGHKFEDITTMNNNYERGND